MNIETYKKHTYGVEREYIKDPLLADFVTTLTGRKTVEAADKAAIQAIIEAVTGEQPSFTQVVA